LLAVRGHREHALGPTIGDIARYLLVKPHTATELAARAARAGLVRRVRDPDDGRLSRLQLTTVGETKLAEITRPVLEEISRLRPALDGIWDVVDDGS
jgi:DNA-binding MarR family transcriptional regulator